MELLIDGRLNSGSNAVFHARDNDGERWVIKPVLGERPLVDFPAGELRFLDSGADAQSSLRARIHGTLAAREIATYLLASAMGWHIVPETIAVDTELGPAAAQRFVLGAENTIPAVRLVSPNAIGTDLCPVLSGTDSSGDTVVLVHESGTEIRQIALLDAVINNADRKAGHVLRDSDGSLWGIDHGLTFHRQPKARSVLWGFSQQPLNDDEKHDIAALHHALTAGSMTTQLGRYLDVAEVAATIRRVTRLLETEVFPGPYGDFPLPWPLW